jgi:hypothetical protein
MLGDMKNAYKILLRKHHRKRPLEKDLDIDWRIMLKWILQK